MSEAKTAIVTGAGTGIGKNVATTLVKAGWNVVFCGRRKDVLDAAVAEAGGNAHAIACDVSKESDVDDMVAETAARYGRLDLLFNNAGISYPSTLIDEIPVDRWRAMVDINLTGSFLCARAAFRQMRNQDPQGGRIINNGSISAYAPRPGTVPYTATKHAITGLTRTLALDGRPFDIACGQIDIGNAGTNMTTAMQKGVPQANGTLEVEPVMDVQNVGDAVLHMASLPLSANILFMNVMATKMPFVGRG
ncbi:MAG: SDR family oxidoreductase [Brucellaceae bacterium]|nr:SDR family oxidoreductase [Brucellaceae bacterium]